MLRRSACISLTASLLALACAEGATPSESAHAPTKSRPAPGPIERALRADPPPAPAPAAVQPGPIAARVEAPVARVEAPAPVARVEVEVTREPVRQAERAVEVAPVAGEGLVLTRAVLARAIEDREPVEGAITAADERVHLFLEVRNAGEGPVVLAVEFIEPDGTVGQPIALEVPTASRWRTWASTRRVTGRAGAWSVRVRDGERELTRRDFEVSAAATPAST